MYEEKNLNFTLNQQTLASTIIKRIRKEEIEPKFIYLPSGIPNITSHLYTRLSRNPSADIQAAVTKTATARKRRNVKGRGGGEVKEGGVGERIMDSETK